MRFRNLVWWSDSHRAQAAPLVLDGWRRLGGLPANPVQLPRWWSRNRPLSECTSSCLSFLWVAHARNPNSWSHLEGNDRECKVASGIGKLLVVRKFRWHRML
jgi:hypothetical protein